MPNVFCWGGGGQLKKSQHSNVIQCTTDNQHIFNISQRGKYTILFVVILYININTIVTIIIRNLYLMSRIMNNDVRAKIEPRRT